MSDPALADNLGLNVLVHGDDPRSDVLCINISRYAKFADLGKAIQAEYRREMDRSIFRLTLVKANLPEQDINTFALQIPDEAILRKQQRVASAWPPGSSIDEALIHVLVQCQSPIPTATNIEETNVEEPTSLEDEPEVREVTKMLRRAQIDFVKAIKSRTSASAAEPKYFRQQQETSNFIRNGRPIKHTGRPIVLYHPVFGRFLTNLRSSDPIPSDSYGATSQYFPISQELYETEINEGGRDLSSRDSLKTLLGDLLMRVESRGVKPDGMLSGHNGACFIVMEMKNEIGSGGSDPSIQAAQSYSRYWGDESLGPLLERCCCPSILIGIAGPWVCILGAVFLDRPLVQPLTHFLWVGEDPARPSEIRYLARVFHCVSLAREELENFYRSPPDGPAHFFPYITHYIDSSKRQVDFTYIKHLGETKTISNKPVFLAKTRDKDQPKQIVVKFVQNYNAEAHELLAERGLAPRLLYDGTAYPEDQPGPEHFMIVMEFVSGTDLGSFLDYPLPKRVSDDIDEALKLLHARDLVFGDLRDPNVMITKDSNGKTRANLVDFDWCGKHRKGRYPPSMNPRVDWAEGMGPEKLMDKQHDLEMRKKLELRRRL